MKIIFKLVMLQDITHNKVNNGFVFYRVQMFQGASFHEVSHFVL